MASSELSWTESEAFVNQIAEYQIFRADKVGAAEIGPFALIGTNVVERDEFGEITNPVTSLEFSDGTVDFVTEAYNYRIDGVPVFVGEAPSPQTPPGRSNILALGTPPSAPVLSAVQDGVDIDLTWIASTPSLNPIDFYTVFRSINGGAFVVIGTTDESTLAFTDDDVDRDADNPSYKVTGTDEVGIESDDSNTVDFPVLSPVLVAISESGTADQRVALSFDAGRTWDLHSATATNLWDGIAFSESQGLLVAVSRDGANRVMTSTDGVIWTARSAAAALQWRDVAYSPTLDLFVAVADSGTGNRVMSSPDGIVWTIRVSPADLAWEVVRWVPFLGLFIAGANSASTTDTVMTSSDGINWVQQTVASGSVNSMATSLARVAMRALSNFFGLTTDDGTTYNTTGAENSGVRALAFGAGLFVCVGPNSATRQNSSDGIAWANVAMPSNSYLSIVFYEETGEFVTLGSAANSVTSDDGISWVEHAAVLPSLTWGAIIEAKLPTDFVEQEMVMVENNAASPVAALSFNAVDWETNATAFPFRLDDVAWSSPLGLYCAVGDGVCVTSPDGIVWTPRTVTAQDWQTVYWSDGLALFIAGADESGTNQIMTSPDGITWTTRTTPTQYRGHDFVEHPTGNGGTLPRIAAVGLDASTNPLNNMLFSDDGFTWSTSATAPSNRVVACTYDSTLDRVVVIETGGQCNVSSDCSTYTLDINSGDITGGNQANQAAVDYSPTLDQLVFGSSANGLWSSEDGGASWTQRDANAVQDVKWSTVLSQWIACDDSTPLVLTSSDGITWAQRFLDTETWSAIALGDEI